MSVRRTTSPSTQQALFFAALFSLLTGATSFAPAADAPTFVCRGLGSSRPLMSVVLRVSDSSKWDNLVDEDDDDDGDEKSRIPADMKYVLPNIKRQNDNFEAIRNMGGLELTSDVWLGSPADSTVWFVGRVARVSDVSPERAIDRQFPLIERHAWVLRPTDLHPSRRPFLVYYAPGETEEFVSRNDPGVPLTRVEEGALGGERETVRTVEVGFRGAAYGGEGGEEGGVYGVDLGMAEEEEEEEEEVILESTLADLDDEEMGEVVEKLRNKPIEKFFDDDDWKEFVDKV